MIGAGAMMGIGAVASIAGGFMKKKPKIPTYKPIDQTAEQEAAIAANLASFDDAKQLADQTTMADQDRLDSILARTMPNYKQLLSGSGQAVQDMIAGNLPNADQNVLMRKAAERSGALGIGGSSAGRNLTARDLGLSSLQMTQAGLNSFNALSSNLRQNYTVNPMSTASMYVSPSQRISNAINENQFRHNALVQKRVSDANNSVMNQLGNSVSALGGMAFGAGAQGLAMKGMFGATGAASTASAAAGGVASSGLPQSAFKFSLQP